MKFNCSNLIELKQAMELATNNNDEIRIRMKNEFDSKRTHYVSFTIKGDGFYVKDFGWVEK